MLTVTAIIIENQYNQFKTIRERLSDLNYVLFPEQIKNDHREDLLVYKKFIDLVRIALNKRYGAASSDDAFIEVVRYIKEKAPDILIIDHKLVGNHTAETGIHLAKKLWAEDCRQPVLFLSRTPKHSYEVNVGLEEYTNKYAWLYKGYSDHQILEKEYFEKEVHPAVLGLLSGIEEAKQQEDVDLILTDVFPSKQNEQELQAIDFKRLRRDIEKIKNLTEDEQIAINVYKKSSAKKFDLNLTKSFFLITLPDIVRRNEQKPIGKGQEYIEKLKALPCGHEHFVAYEILMSEILKFLFENDLGLWKQQQQTEDKISRFDLVCSIKDEKVFWKKITQSFHSDFVLFEFKNYCDHITQNQVTITHKYFNQSSHRTFAVIVSRKGPDYSAMTVAKSYLNGYKNLIMFLHDIDIIQMLDSVDHGKDPNEYLRNRLDDWLITVSD